jgi:hypothetical protein
MNLIVTSCSNLIWEEFGNRWSSAAVASGDRAIVYVDSVVPTCKKVEFKKYPKEVDGYSADPRFVAASCDASIDKNRRYYRVHSRFWLRKVFAVLGASEGLADGDLLCWTDMDCMASNMPVAWASASKHDVMLPIRESPTDETLFSDTGFITFRISRKTKELISKWAWYYSSGAVFKTEFWADNYTLDLLRKGPFSSLDWHRLRLRNGNISDGNNVVARHLIMHKKMKSLRDQEWWRLQKGKA